MMAIALGVVGSGMGESAFGQEAKPAKELFGGIQLPSKGRATPLGFYAKGCLSGGVAIPTDGPTWQAIHLSRNRRWGHPDMIALIEKLSRDAAEKDGWPGLLLGDISQPRGGPMLTGHSSHQIGLDADIWLTPMPNRRLNYAERENIAEYSMLKNNSLRVDPDRWTPAHARLIMRAASYSEVERIFVHPGIKKKLCDTWKGDRAALGKVRPYYGHFYHFHIRIHCPPGASGCTPQAPVPAGDGCGKQLAWWLSDEPWAKPKTTPDPIQKKPIKPRFVKLSDLPQGCAIVLNSPAVPETQATANGSMTAFSPAAKPASSLAAIITSGSEYLLPNVVPIPRPRPADQ